MRGDKREYSRYEGMGLKSPSYSWPEVTSFISLFPAFGFSLSLLISISMGFLYIFAEGHSGIFFMHGAIMKVHFGVLDPDCILLYGSVLGVDLLFSSAPDLCDVRQKKPTAHFS